MKKRKGFTMVELMVVIIIMAILGLAIMPALMGSSEKAKYSRAWSDLDAIANAFTAYYGKEGTLPTITGTVFDTAVTEEDEKELLQSFLGTPLANLKDPWNESYQIKSTWDPDTGKGHVIVYVKGTGTASFSTINLSNVVRLDPYNGDEPMARLVINVM